MMKAKTGSRKDYFEDVRNCIPTKSMREAYELETDLVGFIVMREINHQRETCAIGSGCACHFSFRQT
jgi:hypothetical protein